LQPTLFEDDVPEHGPDLTFRYLRRDVVHGI
jgi:hypothetical protein